MKPKKVTPEGEQAALQQHACYELVTMAAQLMIDDVKAPMTMIVDRFFTFAMAHAVQMSGRAHAAAVLRAMADAVEADVIHSDPDGPGAGGGVH